MRLYLLLGALAVLHLLGILSFFTVPFGFDMPRNLYAEALDVEFWVFPAIFVATWGLVSLLLILRHRKLHQPGEARSLRLLAIGVCAILLAFAVGASGLATSALPVLGDRGADLPEPTLVFFAAPWAFFLLPALAVVAASLLFFPGDSLGKAARFSSASLIGLLVLANLSLLGALGALFLPFFGCGFYALDSDFSRLHAAAVLGRADSARRLIERGADVNAEDRRGFRPLDQARERTGIVPLLVERGAVRSTPESRQRKLAHNGAQKGAQIPFGSCSV